MKKVAVVGGGISGLVVAHELLKRGRDVTVLEREDRAGGKVQSQRMSGFLCEGGPSGFLHSDPVLSLVEELGLRGRLIDAEPAAKDRFLAFQDTLHAVPMSLGALIGSKLLPMGAKLRLLADLFVPRGPGGDETVASFASRRLGRVAAERLVGAICQGIFAGDLHTLSLPAAFPKMAALERDYRSLLLAAGKKGGVGGRGVLRSFDGGMRVLIDALATRSGSRLRTGLQLKRIRKTPEGFQLQIEDAGRQQEMKADVVVLAQPAWSAANVLRNLDENVVADLEAISYAPVVVVHLGWAQQEIERPFTGYGFLVPPSEPTRILGTIFSSQVFVGRAPKGALLLTTMVGGMRRPELAGLSDDETIGLVCQELRQLLSLAAAPKFANVIRWERAIPQYTLGHGERVAATEAAERRHPGLYFGGNSYRGISLPDCVRESVTLAGRIS